MFLRRYERHAIHALVPRPCDTRQNKKTVENTRGADTHTRYDSIVHTRFSCRFEGGQGPRSSSLCALLAPASSAPRIRSRRAVALRSGADSPSPPQPERPAGARLGVDLVTIWAATALPAAACPPLRPTPKHWTLLGTPSAVRPPASDSRRRCVRRDTPARAAHVLWPLRDRICLSAVFGGHPAERVRDGANFARATGSCRSSLLRTLPREWASDAARRVSTGTVAILSSHAAGAGSVASPQSSILADQDWRPPIKPSQFIHRGAEMIRAFVSPSE